jgi:hypothetical protein
MMYDSTQDTLDHITKVQTRINEFTNNLTVRASCHDISKLAEPEKSGYDTLTQQLKDLEYGSAGYKAALEEARPVIQHHYAVNDHHPEHTERGISGMSLPALVEMFCDWKAASERTKQGSIMQSLGINQKRFGIDAQLLAIFENTVKELNW